MAIYEMSGARVQSLRKQGIASVHSSPTGQSVDPLALSLARSSFHAQGLWHEGTLPLPPGRDEPGDSVQQSQRHLGVGAKAEKAEKAEEWGKLCCERGGAHAGKRRDVRESLVGLLACYK